tara:strand:- start:254 stop:424 length:171 start_codon:yes stop_codon:yes gene_type:complete
MQNKVNSELYNKGYNKAMSKIRKYLNDLDKKAFDKLSTKEQLAHVKKMLKKGLKQL